MVTYTYKCMCSTHASIYIYINGERNRDKETEKGERGVKIEQLPLIAPKMPLWHAEVNK